MIRVVLRNSLRNAAGQQPPLSGRGFRYPDAGLFMRSKASDICRQFGHLLVVALLSTVAFVVLHGSSAAIQLRYARDLGDAAIHGTTAPWQLAPGRGATASGAIDDGHFRQIEGWFPRPGNLRALFPPRGPSPLVWLLVAVAAASVALLGAWAGIGLARLWCWPRYDRGLFRAASHSIERRLLCFRAARLALVVAACCAPLIWWLTEDRDLSDHDYYVGSYPRWPLAHALAGTFIFVVAALLCDRLYRRRVSMFIDIASRRCEACGYDAAGPAICCPECGRSFPARATLRRIPIVRRVVRRAGAIIATLVLVSPIAIAFGPKQWRARATRWILVHPRPPDNLDKSSVAFRWFELVEIGTPRGLVLLQMHCAHIDPRRVELDAHALRYAHGWITLDLRDGPGASPIVSLADGPFPSQYEGNLVRHAIDIGETRIDVMTHAAAHMTQLVTCSISPRPLSFRRLPPESGEYSHERRAMAISLIAQLNAAGPAAAPER